MDFLEYPSVTAEVRGAMVGGNLRITDKEVVFKHAKSGKKDVVKVATSIFSFLKIGMFGKGSPQQDKSHVSMDTFRTPLSPPHPRVYGRLGGSFF